MRRIFVTALVASSVMVSLPAEAKKRFMSLAVTGDQRSRMDGGMRTVESAAPHSNVRIFQSEDEVSKRGALMILVLNASDQPMDVGSENITFTSGAEPIKTIGYDRLVKEEKKRQKWAAIATALSAMGNSASAANAGYSSGTVNAFGTGGFATANYSSYNPGAAYAAQSLANAQNAASFDRLAATNAASMEALKSNMRTTTVDPGQSFGGLVTYELPKDLRSSKVSTPMTITVKVGDDVHTFTVAIEPEK